MWHYNSDHPLRRYFSGVTEQTFVTDLGVADPALIDYLSEMLSRFVHVDAIFKLRSGTGRRLEEVADMLMEAEAVPLEGAPAAKCTATSATTPCSGRASTRKSSNGCASPMTKDHFIDYCEQGKRTYYIASTFEEEPYKDESPVLRRLSERSNIAVRLDEGAPRMGTQARVNLASRAA